MKIYHVFLDRIAFRDRRRTIEIYKHATLLETHRTFEGAVNAATLYGFDMSNPNVEVDRGITSWSSYIKEFDLDNVWMEIVEDELMD